MTVSVALYFFSRTVRRSLYLCLSLYSVQTHSLYICLYRNVAQTMASSTSACIMWRSMAHCLGGNQSQIRLDTAATNNCSAWISKWTRTYVTTSDSRRFARCWSFLPICALIFISARMVQWLRRWWHNCRSQRSSGLRLQNHHGVVIEQGPKHNGHFGRRC